MTSPQPKPLAEAREDREKLVARLRAKSSVTVKAEHGRNVWGDGELDKAADLIEADGKRLEEAIGEAAWLRVGLARAKANQARSSARLLPHSTGRRRMSAPTQTKAWGILNPRGRLQLDTVVRSRERAWVLQLDEYVSYESAPTIASLKNRGYRCVRVTLSWAPIQQDADDIGQQEPGADR